MSDIGITCTVSTRNRYDTTLPLCLTAIANQTLPPNEFILFDDGEHRDLRENPIFQHIFRLFDVRGIKWRVIFGEGKGQVRNHIIALKEAKHDFIWRLDDDNVPESSVLAALASYMSDNLGAVGRVVIEPKNGHIQRPAFASNKIEDIYLGANVQWWKHREDSAPIVVDHLYSSFLFRKSIAEYCDELSPIGHREETLLTYEMTRAGYKCLFNPKAVTWHFCNPQGGIRSHNNQAFGMSDEVIFSRKMMSWGVKPTEYSFAALYHGIGDHFAFKSVLPNYFRKNKGKKYVFFTTYPEVFADVPEIIQGSMAEGERLLPNIDKYNEYKFMIDHAWDSHIVWAYRDLYKLPGEVVRGKFGSDDLVQGVGDYIVVSPYSQNANHPKSYPQWLELIKLLKTTGYRLVQIGRSNEPTLDSIDEHVKDKSFSELQSLISGSKTWISVDNFLPHMVNCIDKIIPGVVIFSQSDPRLFGYPYNINILKSDKYLRPNQFDKWDDVKRIDASFESAENIFLRMKEVLKKPQG